MQVDTLKLLIIQLTAANQCKYRYSYTSGGKGWLFLLFKEDKEQKEIRATNQILAGSFGSLTSQRAKKKHETYCKRKFKESKSI